MVHPPAWSTSLQVGPVRVTFHRTLRMPESGLNPLPPSLGAFPLRQVRDLAHRLPADWVERGGVLLPMWTREAMWLDFSTTETCALTVAVGGVDAVTGEVATDRLRADPQGWLSLPRQPWLDGVKTGDGEVRQFVAMPQGMGYTVEGQVTGQETVGGVQLAVHRITAEQRAAEEAAARARREAARAWAAQRAAAAAEEAARWAEEHGADGPVPGTGWGAAAGPAPGSGGPVPGAGRGSAGSYGSSAPRAMGLGAGGRMHQEVYRDTRPAEHYEAEPSDRLVVHLVAAADWPALTGEPVPATPVDAHTYALHQLPWYDYYDPEGTDLPTADVLAALSSVGEVDADHGFVGQQDDAPLPPGSVWPLSPAPQWTPAQQPTTWQSG